jgi:hypothetical protein
MPDGVDVLYTLIDGNQKQFRTEQASSSLRVTVPWFNNFGDNYAVLAYSDKYDQAGFYPVHVSPDLPQIVDLMLLGKDAGFNFPRTWDLIQQMRPTLARLLTAGLASADQGQKRFQDLIEAKTESAACLMNITTAMGQINLRSGSPLDYFQELIWDDTMQRDRFFGWATPDLIDQVRMAATDGVFAPDPGSSLFHPGATSSFKQIQFGEANVQLTFHEADRRTINGVDCVMVEPDIDYYKDLAAHALLEVMTNALTHTLTDPRQVYVLRWIAGRHAGVPQFDPLYTIS